MAKIDHDPQGLSDEILETSEVTRQLREVVRLARIDDDLSWQIIDAVLPKLAQKTEFVNWARMSTTHRTASFRDLAGSIFEQTEIGLTDEDIALLVELMNEVRSSNPYPCFRAACALAKRVRDNRVFRYRNDIVTTLNRYAFDDEVNEDALRYLQLIEKGK